MSSLERYLVKGIVLAGLLAVAALSVRWYGAVQHQAGYDAAVADRAARDAVAVLRRTEENVVEAARQGGINLKITEVKNEELAPVRERIVVKRVRVGTAICGPAAASETDVPAGGNEADPPGRLVREDVERDIRALKLAVEEDLATGRACQAAAREHGLVP